MTARVNRGGERDVETYASRNAEYRGRRTQANWIGGGIAGLTLIAISELSAETFGRHTPSVFPALLLTLIIGAGTAVASSRVKVAYAATKLEKEMKRSNAAETDLLPASLPWPRDAERMYVLSILLLI